MDVHQAYQLPPSALSSSQPNALTNYHDIHGSSAMLGIKIIMSHWTYFPDFFVYFYNNEREICRASHVSNLPEVVVIERSSLSTWEGCITVVMQEAGKQEPFAKFTFKYDEVPESAHTICISQEWASIKGSKTDFKGKGKAKEMGGIIGSSPYRSSGGTRVDEEATPRPQHVTTSIQKDSSIGSSAGASVDEQFTPRIQHVTSPRVAHAMPKFLRDKI
ncbi:hypothetical protein D9613_007464 [Agrocybe pediades]|uniref:Uncharacterized protein n=1 Tax=Agrocybe pediades TaxID=84607 RepID=A0A8H4QMK4_9AGAR|nr:hypothetical protein D9613_007464 [Agrocybe pediades]